MPFPAIRYVASSTKFALGSIHLQCRVKPGASRQREGIISVSDTVIEICVSERAREGEANKAVREVFSNVLKCPKSDVEIIRGVKSRAKTVTIAGFDIKDGEDSFVSKLKEQLKGAIQ